MEDVIIRSDVLVVKISPLGAEIQSVVDSHGVERMWQGDPEFWTGRAPVLFPFAGALKDGYYLSGGRKYFLPQHGFARTSEFRVEKASDSAVTFLMDTPNENYPFDYALRVAFTVRHDALKVDYSVQNNGDTPLYYGVGAHEAYAFPEGADHLTLVFDREESLRRNVLEGAQITQKQEQLTTNSRNLKLRTEHFRTDALVFMHLNSRGVTLESDMRKERIRLDFDDFDYLLVWQKPRAGYMCLEPWTNPPEYTTSDHILSHKPGMIMLTPGKQRTHTHTITFL